MDKSRPTLSKVLIPSVFFLLLSYIFEIITSCQIYEKIVIFHCKFCWKFKITFYLTGCKLLVRVGCTYIDCFESHHEKPICFTNKNHCVITTKVINDSRVAVSFLLNIIELFWRVGKIRRFSSGLKICVRGVSQHLYFAFEIVKICNTSSLFNYEGMPLL